MAQTIQIVPKFSFPSVETYINDYTKVVDESITAAVDTSVKQIYAVQAGKGKDNVWIKKSNRKSAEFTFGKSNFSKYGQPLMQAYQVLDKENSSVWMMRVMPTDAAYAVGAVTTTWKTEGEKFVITHKFETFAVEISGETESAAVSALITKAKDMAKSTAGKDGNGINLFTVKYTGRGSCGNDFGIRVVNNTIAEKDFGITLYEFDVIDKSNGYANVAQYIGGLTSTTKYNDSSSLINDVLEDAEVGMAPIDIYSNEEGIETLYEAYKTFCTGTLGMNEDDVVDMDCFDPINGYAVGTTTTLPGVKIVNTNADLSSTTGLTLMKGTDGSSSGSTYSPDDLYIKAFSGEIDSRIKSSRIMDITVFFDANYSDSVKDAIISTVLLRNNARAFMDCGINDTITTDIINSLKNKYGKYSSEESAALISFDCWNFITKDPDTKKRVQVTSSYFMAPAYTDHINLVGIHVPFVMENARLTNFIKNTIKPVIYEYNTDVKEALYNARFNYIECYGENVYYRSVQNTMQTDVTDLLEENNASIVYDLKKRLEIDANSQLYNFADDEVRNDFIEFEKAKYSEWVGSRLESFDIMFAVSEYEFNHLILHLYVDIVLRGLTKHITTEIDINKRTYAGSTSAADEVTE